MIPWLWNSNTHGSTTPLRPASTGATDSFPSNTLHARLVITLAFSLVPSHATRPSRDLSTSFKVKAVKK